MRETLLIGKTTTRHADGTVHAILANIHRRARATGRKRSSRLRKIYPQEFTERNDFAESEETHGTKLKHRAHHRKSGKARRKRGLL